MGEKMIRFNTQIRNLSPVGVDVFPKTRKKSKRTKQGARACVCVCVCVCVC